MCVGWVMAIRIEDGACGPRLRREAASHLRGGSIPKPRSTTENDEENEDAKQTRQRNEEEAQEKDWVRRQVGELVRNDPQTLISVVGEFGASDAGIASYARGVWAQDNKNKDKEKDKEDDDKEGDDTQRRRAKGGGCGTANSALVELDGGWDWAWVVNRRAEPREPAFSVYGKGDTKMEGGRPEKLRAGSGLCRGHRDGHWDMEVASGMGGRKENEREREKERGKRGKWHLAEREGKRRGGYLENKKTRAGMGSWRGPRDGHGGVEAASMKRGRHETTREEKLRGDTREGGCKELGLERAAAGTSPGAVRAVVVVAMALMVVLLKAQQETAEQQKNTRQAKNRKEAEREMAQEHRQTLADWIKKGGEGAGLKDD